MSHSLTGIARLCATLLMLIAISLAALAAENLYTVVVPLDSEDPEGRDLAYRQALDQVLIRVTGSDDELQLEELAEIFSDPDRYLLRYRPVPDDSLEVTFDGNAIENVLRQARRTLWDADRPLTLVWLAVDWGQGEREIVGSDEAQFSGDASRTIDRNRLLRERVQQTAGRRGIPVAFPLLDTEDLQQVSFSDIWGGFDDRLLEASRRYSASSVLVGRIRPETAQQNRWTFYFGEEQLVWYGEPEEVMNVLANQLAALFAIPGGAPLESYSLIVDGVDSVVAYGKVQQLMDGIGVIEEFSLRSVSGSKVKYSVSVYGGIERLSKALELSGVLQMSVMVSNDDGGAGRGPLSDPNELTFDYRP